MSPHIFSGEGHPPHDNTGMQGGAWPQDLPYPFDIHQYAGTQAFPQFANHGATPPPDYYANSYGANPTQEYFSLTDIYYACGYSAAAEDVLSPLVSDGITSELYYGRVHDPSPNQHYQTNSLSPPPSREEIPQRPYECGNAQKRDEKPPILFSKDGYPGVKVVDALAQNFEGIGDRDSSPIGDDCSGITIRMNFFGYPSSTEVEKNLKNSGRLRARSMQVSTKDYSAKRRPVTKSKLVQEVSKRIQWYIDDLLKHDDLFPFDNSVGEKWRLGRGMKLEDMTITSLENVSKGSWSPVICIDRH